MSHKAAKRERQQARARIASVAKTEPDLVRQLKDQIDFIQQSAVAYDQGRTHEAKRLAVALRVLLHDTGVSHSLLGQLRLKDQITFYDTAEGIDPLNPMTTMGIVNLRLEWPADADPIGSYVPRFETFIGLGGWLPFEQWWMNSVSRLPAEGIEINRRDYVLMVANSEGGAHVAPKFDPIYAALTRDNGFAWTVGRTTDGADRNLGPAKGDPVFAAVRQIAHEMTRISERYLQPLITSVPN